MKIVIVYGSPCSGKSTFVQNEITDNDLVYDYDLLLWSICNRKIHTCQKHSFHNAVMNFRKALIDFSLTNENGTFYLITTYITDYLQEILENVDYEVKLMDTSKEECLQRLENDETRPDKEEWKALIDKWFADHSEKGGEKAKMNELKLKNGSIRLKADSDKDTAELYFFGDICSDEWEAAFSGGKCPKDVSDFLSQTDKYSDIDLHINSGGGDAFAGIAIYNILNRHKGKITTYVDGIAASAASVIAMAGDTIVMPKSSQLMIHQPWGYAVGNADELRKFADSLDICCQSIMEVYYENKAENVENSTLDELVKAESWLTPENAKNYFKNIEIEENTKAVACTSQYFDKYKNYRQHTENNSQELELLQLQLNLFNQE